MSTKRALHVAACVLALCGCATYQPKPLSPADNARALDARSLQDARLRQFVRATLSHDDHTNDRTNGPRWRLTTLTLAALYYHPDIEIAQARLAGAQAAVITARESPNPTLHLANIIDTAAVAGTIPAGVVPLTIGPVIDFILETAGKRAARTARAQRLADAARGDLATAEWQVRGRVRDAMLDLWAARQRLRLTRRQLGLQEQLVRLLEHRLAAGEAAAPDVARERIRYAQTVLAISDLDRAEADARARLAAAIGIPMRGLDGADIGLHAFDHPPVLRFARAWRRTALTERSDVRAGLADYAAAEAALRLAVASQYPNLTFGPGYNYDLGVNRYILDVGGTVPLLHQQQGPIAEALAKRREAAAAFTKVQARAIAAIDEAEADYRASTRGVAAGNAVLDDENRRARQTETAFRAGQADRPTLVSEELVLASAERAHLDSVVPQLRALGALEDALQRPLYEPDIALPLPAKELNP